MALMTRVRGPVGVEREGLMSDEVDDQGDELDGDAGVVDCVGGWRARVARGWLTSLVTTQFISISAPGALGLLPPQVVRGTSERSPPPEERGMSSWHERGEGCQ